MESLRRPRLLQVWLLLCFQVSSIVKCEEEVSSVEDDRSKLCPAEEDINGRWAGSREIGGAYTLKCAPGFAVHGRGGNRSATLICPKSLQWTASLMCEDVDDCAKLKHGCGPLGVCVDRPKGYDCNCEKGYMRRRSKDGEIVCGSESEESVCGGHTCGAYGICINLQGDNEAFETTNSSNHLRNKQREHATFRCECSNGFFDNGTTCIRKDCGSLVDKLGTWSGNTAFGGAYTLTCPSDAFVYGRLTELTLSCPEKGHWPEHPVCVSPAGEAIDAAIVSVRFWTYVTLSIVCVVCAAIAAGLTLGVATLEPFRLEVWMETKSEDCPSKEERKQIKSLQSCARHVRKIVTGDHRLMVTLMLFNTLANEALPIFLDQVSPAIVSILLSVSVVLIFGEVLPSAVCTGPNQHFIAYRCVPFVTCLQWLFYPVAQPVCMLLDKLLPHSDSKIKYSRSELRGLLQLHSSKEQDCVDLARRESEDQPHLVRTGSSATSCDNLEPQSVISSAEMTLINAILDCGKYKVPYVPLSQCVLAWSCEQPPDIIELMQQEVFPQNPRVVIVVSADGLPKERQERPVPTTHDSVRGMVRPRDLCSLARLPFQEICKDLELLPIVEDNWTTLRTLETLNQQRFGLVVKSGSHQVVGAVSKMDILASLMDGGDSLEQRDATKHPSSRGRRQSDVSSAPSVSAEHPVVQTSKAFSGTKVALKRSNSKLASGVRERAKSQQIADYTLLDDAGPPANIDGIASNTS